MKEKDKEALLQTIGNSVNYFRLNHRRMNVQKYFTVEGLY
jgi:hypothetical protein